MGISRQCWFPPTQCLFENCFYQSRGDEAFLVLVIGTETTLVIIVNKNTPCITEDAFGSILLWYNQHLKALPAERLYLFDGGVPGENCVNSSPY